MRRTQPRKAVFKQKKHRAMGGAMLLVFPNPWGCAPNCTLDRRGRAAGAPATDQVEDGTDRKWVGVRTDRVRTKFLMGPDQDTSLRSRRQDTVLSYMGISAQELTPGALAKQKPLKIPRTKFYEQQVRAGALIPANAETARVCAAKFENVGDVLRRRAIEARENFDAQYGAGAFKAEKEMRDLEESQRKAAAKAAETPADTSA